MAAFPKIKWNSASLRGEYNIGAQSRFVSIVRPITQSDSDLLRRMLAGDEDAFQTLYRRCQGPVYRFVLHMSGSPAIAEDVTQEVFMTLIKDGNRFDPSRGTLPAYLLGIGRNLLLRRLQKERVFVTFAAGSDSGSSEPHRNGNGQHPHLVVAAVDPVRNEMIGRVRQAVLSLPPNYREVVVLCDLQEMSYEQAAAALRCALGTVRSRLHRGRSLLMDKLREFRQPVEGGAVAGKAKVARSR
jgi:RNA polymerase sigma-70 factor (ECF subfamily)